MAKVELCDLHKRMLQGVLASRHLAVKNARDAGTLLVVWQEGKIVKLTPDEYERQYLSDSTP